MGDPNSAKPPLTFDDVDELVQLPDPTTGASYIGGLSVRALGPAFEYAVLSRQSHWALPQLPESGQQHLVRDLLRVLSGERRHPDYSDTALEARAHEIVGLPSTVAEFAADQYASLRKRLERGACGAGFGERTARGIAGAFGEMVDNVYEHSEHPETAIVAYRWDSGEFEFAVLDEGIGVLGSLRKSARYQQVLDAGTALATAIREGESAVDKPGRGFGFTKLITALANLQGAVRLTSGDARLDMNGEDLESLHVHVGRVSAAPLQGLLVAVRCRTRKGS